VESKEAKLAQAFSAQFRTQAMIVGAAGLVLAGLSAFAVAYYWSPAYWRVGYEPKQPIEYSHQQHVQHLGLDCRYCHNHVEQSGHANVPTAQVCMNCHGVQWGNIKATSAKLTPLRQAWDTSGAVPWVRVHNLADYAYFNHSVHVVRGVGCVTCHGRIDQMAEVWHAQPLSMAWCLNCHRHPEPHLRPVSEVTNMNWDAALKDDPNLRKLQDETVRYLLDKVELKPPLTCSGCHR
jgi:hypothetical protein